MPPDDTDGLGDDLPGLHDDQAGDDSPSTEADGWDDADLPGLEDGSPSAEPSGTPADSPDSAGLDWTEAELDDWYWRDFGGDRLMRQRFGEYFMNDAEFASKYDIGMLTDSLYSGHQAYAHAALWLRGRGRNREDTWSEMRAEDRAQFRRGWEDYETALAEADSIAADSVIGELAPLGSNTWRSRLGTPKSPPKWIFIGGGFGILGLVLMVGFFLSSGDADDTAVAVPPKTPVVEAAPPSTEATVVDTADPAGVADVSAVPFPTSWPYTATKTASIVPAPDFMTPTPVGAVLPWAFNVTETCQQQVCTYVTAINPLIPDPLFPAPPETTWVVADTGWSLDVTYLSTQSSYGDGTICAIRNHDTFELTVSNEVINGRSIPTAFTGTWVQSTTLDLGASSGNIDLYCGAPWEVVDEWSLVGVTA